MTEEDAPMITLDGVRRIRDEAAGEGKIILLPFGTPNLIHVELRRQFPKAKVTESRTVPTGQVYVVDTHWIALQAFPQRWIIGPDEPVNDDALEALTPLVVDDRRSISDVVDEHRRGVIAVGCLYQALHTCNLSLRSNQHQSARAAGADAVFGAGWSSQVARRVHGPEVDGSKPSPATTARPAGHCDGRIPTPLVRAGAGRATLATPT